MAKQTSFQLNEESEKVLVQYGKYVEEVNKKVGLPITSNLSKNQLVNGALRLLGVCNDKYNVFTVGKGMELYT